MRIDDDGAIRCQGLVKANTQAKYPKQFYLTTADNLGKEQIELPIFDYHQILFQYAASEGMWQKILSGYVMGSLIIQRHMNTFVVCNYD